MMRMLKDFVKKVFDKTGYSISPKSKDITRVVVWRRDFYG